MIGITELRRGLLPISSRASVLAARAIGVLLSMRTVTLPRGYLLDGPRGLLHPGPEAAAKWLASKA